MKVTSLIGIVGAVILLILGGMVVILRNQLEAKEFELSTANATIKTQADSIARITAQRKIDDRIVTEFTKGLAELRATADAQTTAISELEKSDPNVKSFLETVLPGSLGILLSNPDASNQSGSSNPTR